MRFPGGGRFSNDQAISRRIGGESSRIMAPGWSIFFRRGVRLSEVRDGWDWLEQSLRQRLERPS